MRQSILLTLTCLLTGAALGHHGIGNFDHNKDVNLTGVITEIAFINPHSWIYIDVTAPDGSITAWRCELRAATMLRRSGWTPEMFPTGTLVQISGSPERREPNTCYTSTIVLENGTRLDRYGQITQGEPLRGQRRFTRLANGVPSINGDWAASQGVLTDPRGKTGAFVPLEVAEALEPGAIPAGTRAFPASRGTPESLTDGPLAGLGFDVFPDPVTPTELGRLAMEQAATSVVDHVLSCEPDNILYDLSFEGHVNRITQTEDEIRIVYGFMDIERTIHMTMRAHPDSLEPSFTGHSIGRWEDDVLIVDTIGFTPGRLARTSAVRYSENLHVVERFRLSEDGTTLTREYVATDPYFVGEYRGSDVLRVADVPYQPYACDDRTRRDAALEQ